MSKILNFLETMISIIWNMGRCHYEPQPSKANVCDSGDDAAFKKFMQTLKNMGAKLRAKDWAAGVDISRMKIDNETFFVLADSWFVTVEGSEEIVNKIMTEYKK